MKTLFNVQHFKQLLKWLGELSSWRSCLLWLSLLRSAVRRSLLNPATVSKAVQIGLRAISRTWKVNHRFIIAVVFMLVLAPVAGIIYHAFDRKAVMVLFEGQHFYDAYGVRWDQWYHKNLFFFFMVQGPHIAQTLFFIGIFFLFPENSRRAYFLIIPLAISISKILWLCMVNSNDEFYATPGFYYMIVAAAVAWLLLSTFNYLVHRKYHWFDALCTRVITLAKDKSLDPELRNQYLEQEAEKLRVFNQQY